MKVDKKRCEEVIILLRIVVLIASLIVIISCSVWLS